VCDSAFINIDMEFQYLFRPLAILARSDYGCGQGWRAHSSEEHESKEGKRSDSKYWLILILL
jgi:hypothetical protein